MNMAYDLSADELVFADLSNLSREYCTYRIKVRKRWLGCSGVSRLYLSHSLPKGKKTRDVPFF